MPTTSAASSSITKFPHFRSTPASGFKESRSPRSCVRPVLNKSLTSWNADEVHESVTYLFLKRTGLFWKGNRLIEEHFAVTIIRHKLISSIENLLTTSMPVARILLFLSDLGQLDLILQYTHFFLRSKGYRVLYMGTDITIENLQSAIHQLQPHHIITFLQKKSTLDLEAISRLLEECKPHGEFFVIRNNEEANPPHQSGNIKRLEYEEILRRFNGKEVM